MQVSIKNFYDTSCNAIKLWHKNGYFFVQTIEGEVLQILRRNTNHKIRNISDNQIKQSDICVDSMEERTTSVFC